jgi:hypothetical protein
MSKWTIHIISLAAVGLGLGVLTGALRLTTTRPRTRAAERGSAGNAARGGGPPAGPTVRSQARSRCSRHRYARGARHAARAGTTTASAAKTSATAAFQTVLCVQHLSRRGEAQFYQIGAKPQKDSVIGGSRFRGHAAGTRAWGSLPA